MKEIKCSEQSNATGKAAYEKPAMQVYELEVENAMLVDSGYTSGNINPWYPNGNDPVDAN